MQYLTAGTWDREYPVNDIGTQYPHATGDETVLAEHMSPDTCGDLILLAYMHQQATGSTHWAKKYSGLFKTYADYLMSHVTSLGSRSSQNVTAGVALTDAHLAIKSAIALNAYGTMFRQSNYTEAGKSLAKNL